MIRALIFDFDGLILDTETPDFLAWQQVYRTYGAALSFEEWAIGIGTIGAFDPVANLEARLGHTVDRAAADAARRERYYAMIAEEAVIPGVHAYLDDAERLGLRLAVASSSSHGWVRGHLERLGLLGRFQAVCCREEGITPKPEPDVYLQALAALGVRGHEALALEDSPHGITAAVAAGLYCVAVPNTMTRRMDTSAAHIVIPSLAEVGLEALLARVKALTPTHTD
jgi:HAD superfamily hydrolase (TIGR01509 family)